MCGISLTQFSMRVHFSTLSNAHLVKRSQSAMHITKKLAGLAGASEISFSYEFFCPDSDDGFEALRARVDRLSATEPLFIDIVCIGSPDDIQRGLRLCKYAKKVDGLCPVLHLSMADFTKKGLTSLLDQAKSMAIDNLVFERGSNKHVPASNRPSYATAGEFVHVHEVIAFVKREYDGYFCVGVVGYPSGFTEYDTPEDDIIHLKLKADAGADFVIAQHVYEAKLFKDYVQSASHKGVRIPIIPSVMPIYSYDSFLQLNTYCGVHIPPALLAGLQSLQDDDKAVREYGNRHVVQLARDLISAGTNVLHFHTMNLEVVIRNVLQDLGLCGPGAGSRRKLPWRPSADESRACEDVRPIFWANRPHSYVERTAGWQNYPQGRWGAVAESMSFNDLAHAGEGKPVVTDIEERRVLWGDALSSHQEVWEVFARYVEGRLPRLPWCGAALHIETFTITSNLSRLNRAGFLTINSQPRVNAARSDDPTFGWGGSGGYVYQKAYIECFTPPSHLAALMNACNRYPSITFQAVDAQGNSYTNSKTKAAQAITWGVFPAKEIVQPTVVDPAAFLEWKKEAFALWLTEWATIYDDDSAAADIIHDIHDTYFLVNLVDNDYIRGDMFAVFDDAIQELHSSGTDSAMHSSTVALTRAPGSPATRLMTGRATPSPGLFDLGASLLRSHSDKAAPRSLSQSSAFFR